MVDGADLHRSGESAFPQQYRFRRDQADLGRCIVSLKVPLAAKSPMLNLAKLVRDREKLLVSPLVKFAASVVLPDYQPVIRRRRKGLIETSRERRKRRERESGRVLVQFWLHRDAKEAMRTLAEALRRGDDGVVGRAYGELYAVLRNLAR